MKGKVTLRPENLFLCFLTIILTLIVGLGSAVEPLKTVGVITIFITLAFAFFVKNTWQYALWFDIFGLAIWSYGFNNIPFVKPIPLVDVLIAYIVIVSLPFWWRFRNIGIVKRILALLLFLSLVVIFRLFVDVPKFGILAGRDALFAFELWVILPSIAAGYLLGRERLNKYLFWLFIMTTCWFLLYPFRTQLINISPIVGVQRPTPLFAFTTAGFLSVPAFFWFLWHRRSIVGLIGAGASLLILFFVQSRGAYIAFFISIITIMILHPIKISRWIRIIVVGGSVAFMLVLLTPLPGRLGEPVGFKTMIAQLQTLLGEGGPGAGTFYHRIQTWPIVISQVLEEPLGAIIGIGLGRDLFGGFTIRGGVLVRKPHNDFLEVWARTGILGFVLWLGILISLGMTVLKDARRNPYDSWVLALQIVLWIASFGQPAFGFAYITVVWAGLTGLWLGTYLREQTLQYQ